MKFYQIMTYSILPFLVITSMSSSADAGQKKDKRREHSRSSGKPGPRGPQGPVGPRGLPGSAGATGNTGPAGASGAIGATGATGAMGSTGSTGATGSNGSSHSSLVFNATSMNEGQSSSYLYAQFGSTTAYYPVWPLSSSNISLVFNVPQNFDATETPTVIVNFISGTINFLLSFTPEYAFISSGNLVPTSFTTGASQNVSLSSTLGTYFYSTPALSITGTTIAPGDFAFINIQVANVPLGEIAVGGGFAIEITSIEFHYKNTNL